MAFDTLTLGQQAAVFLVVERNPNSDRFAKMVNPNTSFPSLNDRKSSDSDVFIFQYWPTQINDSYEVEYATKNIPGGSHPLYQWIGGSGRSISFEALFTAEVDDSSTVPSILLPSKRYTVDVAGALARLRTFQLPTYSAGRGSAKAPDRLRLYLPNTGFGGNNQGVLCFLKSMRIVNESHFPSGKIRVATVSLEFLETVQQVVSGDAKSSSIKFIGADVFETTAKKYTYTPT